MSSAPKQYEDVIELADINDKRDSLFGVESRTHSPEFLFPDEGDTTYVSPRKKWRSSADVSKLMHQSMDWAQTQSQRMASTVSGTVEIYTAAQMAAMKSLDRWITSLDEGLFIPKEIENKSCPVHSDEECDHTSSARPTSCVSKVDLYQNSRLPSDLPQLRLDPSAHDMVSLAAQYSYNVYLGSARADKKSFVAANLRHGTKAMVLDSNAVDSMATIVLAIRGTQSFKDWMVNMKTEPKRPVGFLDDTTNVCHAGFLKAAKRMIPVVTERLRRFLDDNPHYESYSLLITGHSAGGSVASLLYCHLLATRVSSELTTLSRRFQRVHCVTFGAPPCALRPLFPTPSPESEYSYFYAFINEGDPVPRADKPYIRSLLSLYATPAPSSRISRTYHTMTRKSDESTNWKLPPAHLSLAGQLVVLRRKNNDWASMLRADSLGLDPEEVDACLTTDEVMRQTVFGDPSMHMMSVYAQRIDQVEKIEVQDMEPRRRVRQSLQVSVQQLHKRGNSTGIKRSSRIPSAKDRDAWLSALTKT